MTFQQQIGLAIFSLCLGFELGFAVLNHLPR
jgi:hypothetical protein